MVVSYQTFSKCCNNKCNAHINNAKENVFEKQRKVIFKDT